MNLQPLIEQFSSVIGSATSLTIEPPAEPEHSPEFGDRVGYTYRPTTFVPHHWRPYIIDEEHPERRFVQARLADYSPLQHGASPVDEKDWLAPEPRALEAPGI